MSKSIKLLKRVGEQRLSKYSAVLNKTDNSRNLTVNSRPLNSEEAVWPPTLFFAIVFLSVLALNVVLFILSARNSTKTNYMFSKLKTIQDSLNSNTEHMEILASSFKQVGLELKKTNLKIDEANKSITQLEKVNNANTSTINNLTNAKNTLFNKISFMQAELDSLKKIR